MTFIPDEEEAPEPITSDPFFPNIDPAAFRTSVRIEAAISYDALRHSLVLAVTRANLDLEDFRVTQMASGYSTLSQVPSNIVDGFSALVFDYQEAVYSHAKATLLAQYEDTDTTVLADATTEVKGVAADDFRRRYFEAIRRIIGKPRATIELI